MINLIILGDSLVYGSFDKEGGGWAQLLKIYLDKRAPRDDKNFYCLTYTLGIPGNTTEDLLERADLEIDQRIDGWAKKTIIFAIGLNDCCYDYNKKNNQVPKAKFKNNLNKLVNITKKYAKDIVFVGLTPVNDKLSDPMSWDKSRSLKTKYVEEYNEIIKGVSKEKQCYFIDLLSQFTKIGYNQLLEDGAHPNHKGHEKIFEIVKDYLVKNKLI